MSAKDRYDKLQVHREQFLNRARHNALLTIPSLMPQHGHDGKSHLVEPYQSLGATGVVTLSNRITMALVPPGRPHLRLDIPPKTLLELDGEVPPEINQQLAKSEKLVSAAVEKANWRPSTLQIMQQLIVAGSVTVEFLTDQTFRIHRLDNFVWRRDARGKVLECVISEQWDKKALPPGVTDVSPTQPTTMQMKGTEDDITLYKYVKWNNSKQVYEVQVEDDRGKVVYEPMVFTDDILPFLFLRWSSTPGEEYGRSKTEEVAADLRSYDSMSKQALEQGAMGALNFVMVRPGATATGLKQRITRMRNGDVVIGDPDSVDTKQFANTPGFQIVMTMIQTLEQRISRAFLLGAAQQRNAERVTAAEIERDIQELEGSLGGTYSNLSLEFLERATSLLMQDMKLKKEFPPYEEEQVMPVILTGLEALSRERDVSRGMQAAQIASQFGPEGLSRLKMDVILDKIMTGLGFPDAIKTEEQVMQEQQAAQMAQMQQAAVGPAINAAAKQET